MDEDAVLLTHRRQCGLGRQGHGLSRRAPWSTDHAARSL